MAVVRGAAELGLVVTGTAELRDPQLVGLGLVVPGQILLLGTDPAALTGVEPLALFGRTSGWFAPLEPGVLTRDGPGAFAAALASISAEANTTAGPLTMTWPSDVILSAAARADASRRRFLLLGAGSGALQLGFCLSVAAGQRRQHRQHARLLGRRGAGRAPILQVASWPPLIAVSVGLLAGTALGFVGVVGLSRVGPTAPGRAGVAAVAAAWPASTILALAAVILSVALLRWPDLSTRSVRLGLGLALAAAAGLVALAAAGPPRAPDDPLPIVGLVALTVAVGLVAALIWRPLTGALAQLIGPRRWRPVVRALIRRPLLSSVTAGFVAAALATALLATTYGASLRQAALDQAAFQVPLDVSVSPSAQVAVPTDAVDLDRLRAVSRDVAAFPVVRSTVTAFAGSARASAVSLSGIDSDALTTIHAFPAVTGAGLTATELASALDPGPTSVGGPTIPAGVHRLQMPVDGLDGDATLVLWLVAADGQERQVPFTRAGAELVAQLEPGPARRVAAVEIVEETAHLMRRQHGVGEGSTDRALAAGTLHLGAVRAAGAALPWSWTGWGSDQATVGPGGGQLSVDYRLSGARVVLVPGWTRMADRTPLSVAVDPGTAARAGHRATFGITLNGITRPARIVAVLPRMPTLSPPFAVADRSAVSTLVDRTAPGTAPVTQVWIRAPRSALAEVRPVLNGSTATVAYRDDLARRLAADPITAAFVRLLGLAGTIALLLSLVAVAGGILSDRHTAAADLYALELDGVPARRLRWLLAGRGALVVVAALPAGLLGSIALSTAAVRLLSVGIDGRPPTPPLHLVLWSGGSVLVTAAAIGGSVLAVGVAAAAVLREPQPAAPEAELR